MKPNPTVRQFHIRRSLLIFDAPALPLPWKSLYLRGIRARYSRRVCLSAVEESPRAPRLFQAGADFERSAIFISSSVQTRETAAEKQQDLCLCHTKEEQHRQTTFTIIILRLKNLNLSLFVSNLHNFFFTETKNMTASAPIHYQRTFLRRV